MYLLKAFIVPILFLLFFALVAVSAFSFKGKKRVLSLIFGPLAILALMFLTTGWSSEDGNMMAAGMFILYVLALFVYYPVLAIVGLVAHLKSKKAQGTESTNLPQQ